MKEPTLDAALYMVYGSPHCWWHLELTMKRLLRMTSEQRRSRVHRPLWASLEMQWGVAGLKSWTVPWQRMLLTASHIYRESWQGVRCKGLSFPCTKEILVQKEPLRSLLSSARELVNQLCYQWNPYFCLVELIHCEDLRKWEGNGHPLARG